MTLAELFSVLADSRALIVHCSRIGKGDEADSPLLFPDDLQNARRIVAKGSELSCSVVWPQHTETFGSVGIVLRPRSVGSITSVLRTDAGTYRDPGSGRRHGAGAAFSDGAVNDTLANSSGHNEWTVRDADTVGIFVNLMHQRLEVSKLVSPMHAEGYEPEMGILEPAPNAVYVTLREVIDTFPDLPVFAFLGTELIQVGVQAGSLYELAP